MSIDKRKAFGDIYGRAAGERASEYFDFVRWPDKAERKVTRHELLFFLTQIERAREGMTWRSRIVRFLKAPLGSGPVKAAPPKGDDVSADIEAKA